MTLAFRPHHFLCALCFQGKGYSAAFIAHFRKIMSHLNAKNGEATVIHITPTSDSICQPCPHRRGTSCNTEPSIAHLDAAHSKALALHGHRQITWGEAKQRLKEKISLETFHDICASCSWQASGICETALKAFLLQPSSIGSHHVE